MLSSNFKQSLIEHSVFLHGVALNLTRNKDAAKDLVQQTLLLALNNEQVFASGTNLRAWLFTILRNSFRTDYQKRRRRRELLHNLCSANMGFAAAEENNGPGKMWMDKIKREMKALPADYYQVLHLRAHGYQYAEISAATGEPVGTVKSRIHAAKRLLKERLSEPDAL